MGILWTDKIDIEGTKGWYGCGEINGVFEIDFDTNRYKYLTSFDDCGENTIRTYSICKKYKNKLFCFPVYGDKIWIYHIEEKIFSKIDDPSFFDSDYLLMYEPFVYNHYLYVLSRKKCAVVEIDPEQECIHSVISIPKEIGAVGSNCIQDGNKLYCSSIDKGVLCQIDLDTKQIELYEIPYMEKGINTISMESADKFWLSGRDKQICIWDKQSQKSIVLTDFPEEFGIYRDIDGKLEIDYEKKVSEDFLFIGTVNIENYMWFIPYRSNKILYVDKDTHKISVLEIPDEQECVDGWKRYLKHKYLINYIRENRYIGLYSTKNGYLFEIDAKELTVQKRDLILDENSIGKFISDFAGVPVMIREDVSDFKKMFWSLSKKNIDTKETSIGEKIYHITT